MADVQIYRYYNDGRYHDVVSYTEAVHEEGLDGTDKLTVTCKESIRKRAHLLWKDELGKWREHIVVSSVRKHNRRKPEKTYVCSNSVDELFLTLAEGTVLKGTVGHIMSKLVSNTRWSTSGNGAFDDEKYELEVWHKNVRECIAELVDMCAGELETSITVGDYGITKRTVRIVEERGGSVVHQQFRYGRNMTNVQRTLASDEVYTAIVGYGKKLLEIELEKYSEELENTDTSDMSDEEREEFDKKREELNEELRKARENPYLERLSVTVKSNADIHKFGQMGANGVMGHAWTTYTDDECSDKDFLRQQCKKIIKAYDHPLVTYDFDAYQIGDDKWKLVKLGNHVHIVDDGFELDSIERISYIKRNLKGRDSCRISIGRRANPFVEKFKAEEKRERKESGNSTRTSSKKSNSTRGSYTSTSPTPSGGFGGATTGDKWIHQIDGVTQAIGTINFVTVPSNSGNSSSSSSSSSSGEGWGGGDGDNSSSSGGGDF